MSQNELAKMSGVKQTAISAWLLGKARPTFDSVCRIATALAMSTEDFRPLGERCPPAGAGKEVRIVAYLGPIGGPHTERSQITIQVFKPKT